MSIFWRPTLHRLWVRTRLASPAAVAAEGARQRMGRRYAHGAQPRARRRSAARAAAQEPPRRRIAHETLGVRAARRLVPLVALYAGHPALPALVERCVRTTQDSHAAVAWGAAAAAILEGVILGKTVTGAMKTAVGGLLNPRPRGDAPGGAQPYPDPVCSAPARSRRNASGADRPHTRALLLSGVLHASSRQRARGCCWACMHARARCSAARDVAAAEAAPRCAATTVRDSTAPTRSCAKTKPGALHEAGARARAGELSSAVAALGSEVVHALAVVLRMLDDKTPLAEALARLGRHSHLPMPLQTAVLLLLQARA